MKYILLFIIFFTLQIQVKASITDSASYKTEFNKLNSDFSYFLYSNQEKTNEVLKKIDKFTLIDTNSSFRLNYYLFKWQYEFNYGEIDVAKESLSNFLNKIEKYDDRTKSIFFIRIASVYVDFKMYDLADEYFRYVTNLKNLPKKSREYIISLNGLSDIYRIRNEMDSAKALMFESLELTKALNDPQIYANSFQFYFNVFFSQYQLDSIEVNVKKLHIENFLDDHYYQSSYYTVMAYYHYLKREVDTAIIYTRKVVEARKKVVNPVNYYSSLNNLGQMFLENGQYDSAYYYLELTKDSLSDTKNIHLIELNIKHLEKLYKINNDSIKLNSLNKYKSEIDSVNIVQIDKINLISKLYLASNKLDESKKTNENYQFYITILIILTILISAFILFFIYYNIRLKEAIKNQKLLINDKISTLKKLEIEVNNKNRLISILSHDLINPINSTAQLLEILKTDYENIDDKEKYEIILELSRASVNTYDLLKDILSWMKVSKDNLYNFNPTHVKIFNLIQSIYEHLYLQLENKDQKIINNIERDHTLNIDSNLMSTIIRNLISNSSKYSDSGKKITLYSEITDTHYIIVIEDEGIGMSNDMIKKLQNNSYNSILHLEKKEEDSFGYGVVICKDFMKVHNGRLEYESDGKTGTRAKLIFNRDVLVKN